MNTKTHCRCRACQARQVKPKHPDDYVRGAVCRSCGRVGTLRADSWMNNRWRLMRTCCCQGYWFPHRMGSRYCHFRANGEVREYGDADFADRGLEAALASGTLADIW